MLSFKEFFFKEQVNPYSIGLTSTKKRINKFKNKTIPHHRRLTRLTGRTGKIRNGKPEGVNLMAGMYNPNNENYDKNSKQQTGPITPAEADKYFKKYNLNPSERDLLKGVGLGNRDFMIQRINHQYFIKPKKD